MDSQFFKSSFEIIEADKKEELFLLLCEYDGEEGYIVADKSEIDVVRDGYTRLNDNVIQALEQGVLTKKVYDSRDIEDAFLEFEQLKLAHDISSDNISDELKEATVAYSDYLATVKEGLGGADWRDSIRDKDEFIAEKILELKKRNALEKISQYKADKSYERSTPYCLRDKALFVGWRYSWSDKSNKIIKIPISPKTGRAADTTNFHDWTNFERACQAVDKFGLHGVGIVFNGRGLMGIDIDDCMDASGKLVDSKAREIVDRVNSYTEISPSGTGIHILCYGNLPTDYGYKRKDSLEMYDTGRFFTLTGKVLEGKFRKIPMKSESQPAITDIWNKYLKRERPAMIDIDTVLTLDDDELIFKISTSKRAKDFKRMFEQGLPPIDEKGEVVAGCRKNRDKPGTPDNVDWSKVDLCLCGMLAFYNPPRAQADRIFRASKLMRSKWDEMRGGLSYGQKTLEYAYRTRQMAYSSDIAKARGMERKHLKRIMKEDIME